MAIYSTLYTILTISVGVTLALLHAIVNDESSAVTTFYLELVFLYLYITSSVFLLYIGCYMVRSKDSSLLKQKPDNEDNSKDETAFYDSTLANQSQTMANSITANSISCSTPVENKKAKEELAELVKQGSLRFAGVDAVHEQQEEPPEVIEDPDTLYVPVVDYRGIGVNFFLRFGLLVFALCVVIEAGFHIAEFAEHGRTILCRSYLNAAVLVSQIVFVMLQSFFLFRNHRAVFNKHVGFVRFALMHVLATNLVVWFALLIKEVEEDVKTSGYIPASTGTRVSPNITRMGRVVHLFHYKIDCHKMASFSDKAHKYLFPCLVQFVLCSTGIIYHIYNNVGQSKHYLSMERSRTQDIIIGILEHREERHRSHHGLFCGMLLAVLSLVGISVLYILTQKLASPNQMTSIFVTIELISIILALCLAIGLKLQLSRFVTPKSEVKGGERMTLYVTIACLYTYDVITAFAAVRTFYAWGAIWIPILAISLVDIVQASLQTDIILKALGTLQTENDHQYLPNRLLTVLTGAASLLMWSLAIVDIRKQELLQITSSVYGGLAWSVLWHTVVPLKIFYRFFAATSFAYIWAQTYELKKHGAVRV